MHFVVESLVEIIVLPIYCTRDPATHCNELLNFKNKILVGEL